MATPAVPPPPPPPFALADVQATFACKEVNVDRGYAVLHLLSVSTVLHVPSSAAAACSGKSLEGNALCTVTSLPSSSVSAGQSLLSSQLFSSWLCLYAPSV